MITHQAEHCSYIVDFCVFNRFWRNHDVVWLLWYGGSARADTKDLYCDKVHSSQLNAIHSHPQHPCCHHVTLWSVWFYKPPHCCWQMIMISYGGVNELLCYWWSGVGVYFQSCMYFCFVPFLGLSSIHFSANKSAISLLILLIGTCLICQSPPLSFRSFVQKHLWQNWDKSEVLTA